MQTTRPRITWKVLPMAQVAIFKRDIRSSAKRFGLADCFIKTNIATSHIIFTILATDNIHVVLKTITPC